MIIIKSLRKLKSWNKKPTEEKPYVIEWFMDWFFEKLLENDKFKKAEEAFNVFVEFTEKCEHMSKEKAQERVMRNLNYYSDHSNVWRVKYNILTSIMFEKKEKL